MLFVLLSHFGQSYFGHNGSDALLKIFLLIGMVATPSFIVISGSMLGYFYETRKENFGLIRYKMIERGLFMMTIGHLLIAYARLADSENYWSAFSSVFVTDTIGFCIVLGPALYGLSAFRKPSVRLISGIVLFAVSWVGILCWSLEGAMGIGLKFAIIGAIENARELHPLNYSFPLLPWFAVYVASTCIGEKIGQLRDPLVETYDKICHFLLRLGVSSLAGAALLFSGVKIVKTLFPGKVDWLSPLGSPYEKLPPGPAYLMFYGGIGILILYLFFRFENRAVFERTRQMTATLGQTSLFVFLLQFYVYAFFSLTKLDYSAFWPIYFLGSVAFTILISQIWLKKGLNRYLGFRWVNEEPS